jgi:hypothetical protein
MTKYLIPSLLLACSLPAAAQAYTSVAPKRADDICAFTGVNGGVTADPVDPASNWGLTWWHLQDLNIRTIRWAVGWKGLSNNSAYPGAYDAYPYNAALPGRAGTIHRDYGVKSQILIGGIYTPGWGGLPTPPVSALNPAGTPHIIDQAMIDTQLNLIKTNYVAHPTYGDCVSAIEGQNEYWTYTANSANVGARLNKYTETIASRRAALGLGAKQLICTSIWFEHNTQHFYNMHNDLGNVYSWANFGNLHYYPGYKTPSDLLSTYLDHHRNTNLASGTNRRKVVVSECGLHTTPGIHSAKAQAKMLPRYICEQFDRSDKVEKCLIYSMLDRVGSGGGQFGLIGATNNGTTAAPNWSFSPKPSYYAVKNFLGRMKEATWNRTTRQWEKGAYNSAPLPFRITDKAPDTRYLLVRKAAGEYLMMLWRDLPVSSDAVIPEESTGIVRPAGYDLVNYQDGVWVQTNTPVTEWKLYRPLPDSNDWNYSERTGNDGFIANGGTTNQPARYFTVPDHVIILSIKL